MGAESQPVSLGSDDEGKARKAWYQAYARKVNKSVSKVMREATDEKTGFRFNRKIPRR